MTRLASNLLLASIVFGSVAGCSGGDGDGPAVDASATADANPSAVDGDNGPDAIPVDCPGGDGAPVLVEESNFWDGTVTACGTVTLPEDATSGRFLQLLVHRVDGLGGNEFLGPGTTNAEKRVHFRIALEAGEYRIGLRVDDTGDSVIGSGDL